MRKVCGSRLLQDARRHCSMQRLAAAHALVASPSALCSSQQPLQGLWDRLGAGVDWSLAVHAYGAASTRQWPNSYTFQGKALCEGHTARQLAQQLLWLCCMPALGQACIASQIGALNGVPVQTFLHWCTSRRSWRPQLEPLIPTSLPRCPALQTGRWMRMHWHAGARLTACVGCSAGLGSALSGLSCCGR